MPSASKICYNRNVPGVLDCEYRRCSRESPCADFRKAVAVGAGAVGGGFLGGAAVLASGLPSPLVPLAAGGGMLTGLIGAAVVTPNSETEGYCQCFTQHG